MQKPIRPVFEFESKTNLYLNYAIFATFAWIVFTINLFITEKFTSNFALAVFFLVISLLLYRLHKKGQQAQEELISRLVKSGRTTPTTGRPLVDLGIDRLFGVVVNDKKLTVLDNGHRASLSSKIYELYFFSYSDGNSNNILIAVVRHKDKFYFYKQ